MDRRISEIDAWFTNLAQKERAFFSGAVLIAQGDKVLLRKDYGYADQEVQAPNTPETIYRIGHLSGLLTTVGVLLLEAQGKLSLQDQICAYLDECPAAWEQITLHQLLGHTSGIPSYRLTAEYTRLSAATVTPEELVALVRDKPLIREPKSAWELETSQTNYALLGLVIERVSGQPYGTFMQEQVFAPLGMSSTSYAQQPEGLAVGHMPGHRPAAPFDVTAAYAGFGLSSTVDDLYRLERALQTDTLLPKAQREAMMGTVMKDAYGWEYGYSIIQGDWYLPGHNLLIYGLVSPNYPGFWTTQWSLTDLDITVIILANQEYANNEDLFSDMVADFLLK